MTLDEFRDQAEIWGGDLRRWPPAHREAAQRLSLTPEGAAILAQASALDALIAPVAPEISERRAADAAYAVMARLAKENAPQRRGLAFLRLPHWLMPGTGFAAAAALGIAVGFAYPIAPSETEMFAQTALAAILDNNPVGQDWVLQ